MKTPDDPLPEPPDSRHHLDSPLVQALFGRLAPPVIPAALASPGFLEGIYESAAAAEARALGPVLNDGLVGVAAPEDATWLDDHSNTQELDEIRGQVEAVLPRAPGPAPGMLWTRIRADIRAQQAPGSAHVTTTFAVRWMRRAAAALLLGASLFGLARILPPTEGFFPADGTQREITFVDQTSPSGIDDSFLGGGR